MKQDIILSTLFWKSFLESGKESARKARNFLESDTLIVDKNKVILKEYKDFIKILSSQDNNHFLLSGIMQDLESGNGCEIVEIDIKKRNLHEYSSYESEKKIKSAWEGFWKLIIKENNFNNYVMPNFLDFYRNEERIVMKTEESFCIRRFLRKYYCDSKSIEIKDPYIFINRTLFENVKFICKDFSKEITITTVKESLIKQQIKKAIENKNHIIPLELCSKEEFSKLERNDKDKYLSDVLNEIKNKLLSVNSKIIFTHIDRNNCKERELKTDFFILDYHHSLEHLEYTFDEIPSLKNLPKLKGELKIYVSQI